MIKRQKVKNSDKVKLTFVQQYNESTPRTYVVGDFNEWDASETPMIKRSNGTISASITVEPEQRVRFRYYTEDGVWFNDEAADAYEPGEAGEDNCVVVV